MRVRTVWEIGSSTVVGFGFLTIIIILIAVAVFPGAIPQGSKAEKVALICILVAIVMIPCAIPGALSFLDSLEEHRCARSQKG